MNEREALKLALEALRRSRKAVSGDLDLAGCAYGRNDPDGHRYDDAKKALVTLDKAITAIKEALAQPEQEPVAWKYDVTYNQDGTVSVALPDGDELRIVLPNQQEPYCWTWDVWVSGGKWRAEYGWEKPTEKVVNLQPLYTAPPQRKPLSDEEIYKASTEARMQEHYMGFHSGFIRFARAIEAAHGIKGEA